MLPFYYHHSPACSYNAILLKGRLKNRFWNTLRSSLGSIFWEIHSLPEIRTNRLGHAHCVRVVTTVAEVSTTLDTKPEADTPCWYSRCGFAESSSLISGGLVNTASAQPSVFSMRDHNCRSLIDARVNSGDGSGSIHLQVTWFAKCLLTAQGERWWHKKKKKQKKKGYWCSFNRKHFQGLKIESRAGDRF